MTDPISYTSNSARHNLPFLFAAQAQKEFFVNESLARLDALAHPAVEGELASPPASPERGQCWLVASPADGDWTGEGGSLASFQDSGWLFMRPVEGMIVRDRQAGQLLAYDTAWHRTQAVATPSGGATIDSEARAALAAIIDALAMLGILPPN